MTESVWDAMSKIFIIQVFYRELLLTPDVVHSEHIPPLSKSSSSTFSGIRGTWRVS